MGSPLNLDLVAAFMQNATRYHKGSIVRKEIGTNGGIGYNKAWVW